MAAKAGAFGFEFAAQLAEIINLAVEGDDEAAVGRGHRLMAGRRQIDDGKPAMGERDAGVRIAPEAVIVGAAMGETVGHGGGVALERVARPDRRFYDACDAAHSLVHAPGMLRCGW